jgi:amidase
MTVKDGHDVAGLRTTIGSEVFDRTPSDDGTVAARLRAAGAVIVGHTNVPPFLADYTTDNPIFGRTNNPWNLDRTPGGSSGGAAAALAAGLTPVEVGSDLAGSLRLPPHFCGVYGLKATEHRVPTTGFFRPLPGVPRSVRILTALGPMARDLDDLDLVLRVIAGPDGRDTEVPPVPLEARRHRTPARLRLAVATELPGATVEASLRGAVERVAAGASDAGAAVSAWLPDLDWAELRLFGELVEAVTGVFDPGAVLDDERRTLAWYLAALDRRDGFIGAWERFFDAYDALVLPPAMTTAFGHQATGYAGQGYLMVFANLAGLPALTVPAGRDDGGLPVGVQIVGPRWSETRLLEIAGALEQAGILPGFARPPGY